MKALILAEGSSVWGLGHLNRCFGFSQFLDAHGIETHWIIDGDDMAIKFLQDNQLHGHFIKGFDWNNLCVQIPGTDLVIVDSYHAKIDLYTQLARMIPKCLWIDDEARLDYPPGFVLNPNPLVNQQSIRDGKEGKFLLSGYEYQPMRHAFLDPPCARSISHLSRILIVMGGSDPLGLTPQIISVIQSLYESIQIIAIVPRQDQREEWKSLECKDCMILPAQDATEMRKLMEASDLAISAGGQTLSELARLGIPCISIGVAENQRYNLKAMEAQGVIYQALWHDSPTILTELTKQLTLLLNPDIRQKLSKAGQTLIDGQGIHRVCAQLLGWSSTFHLRKVRFEDRLAVWNLSNQESVRHFSLHKNTIPWDQHLQWFDQTLLNSNVLFLIAENAKNQVIGQLRYNVQGSKARVSISLDPKARGKGEATRLLLEADQLVCTQYNNIRVLEAVIHKDNIASINAFSRAGYEGPHEEPSCGDPNFHLYCKQGSIL